MIKAFKLMVTTWWRNVPASDYNNKVIIYPIIGTHNRLHGRSENKGHMLWFTQCGLGVARNIHVLGIIHWNPMILSILLPNYFINECCLLKLDSVEKIKAHPPRMQMHDVLWNEIFSRLTKQLAVQHIEAETKCRPFWNSFWQWKLL